MTMETAEPPDGRDAQGKVCGEGHRWPRPLQVS